MASTAPARGASDSALAAHVVAGLGNLELAARLVVEGAYAGRHRSLQSGLSTDFKEHRPYRPGDALKHVDWKLLARSDRLYTRRYRDTTSLALMVVLDTSASMAFPEAGNEAASGHEAVSRFRYGQVLAASLAWLAVTGGDGAGLLAGTGPGATYLPARGGRRHLRSLVAQLDGLSPGSAGSPRGDGTSGWDGPAAVDRASALLRRRGLVVVISDLYDREDEILAALRRAGVRGHDTALFQLTSTEERTFPWRGALRFEDAETGTRHLVDAGEAAARHVAALDAFHAHCATEAARSNIDFHRVSTDEAPAAVLRRFMLSRAR